MHIERVGYGALCVLLLCACTSTGAPAAPAAATEASGEAAPVAAPEAAMGERASEGEQAAEGEEAAEGEAPADPVPVPGASEAAPAGESTAPAIPAGQEPPDAAPSLPGLEFPNFGHVQPGYAYFPTESTAARLSAGEVEAAGMSWFRGEVLTVEGGVATVKDLQNNEYPVPVAYVIQAREPLTGLTPGDVVLGERFNRAELVIVTGDADEDGDYPTMGLPGFMNDSVREGSDELAEVVPVLDGGIGSNAICHGENGVRNYRILRRTSGQVLGYDGAFVRVLADANCEFAQLRPELQPGDEIVYTWSLRYRRATVRSVDTATGAVTVAYPWGAEEREDTARFGSIVREVPSAPAE